MFSVLKDDSWLWHRRLRHTSMIIISILSKKNLVDTCDACQFGKQVKNSFKSKKFISTSRLLQLLHMDLFGLSMTTNLDGKYYAFVIVDDFLRFKWILFLAYKDDVLKDFTTFCKKIQNEKGYTITSIKSDHDGVFDNDALESFYNECGFEHNFSTHRTPQQNSVVERKNRTLQEMARTMLSENDLPTYFWAEVVNTSCHVLN